VRAPPLAALLVCPFAACWAAFKAAFCLRFCFLRLTVGAGSLSGLEASSGGALALAVVGVEGKEDSEVAPLGTVINLEPSLLVYFAVFRGDTGVWAAGLWLLAGIVGYGSKAVEGMKMLCATRVCRWEDGV